MRRILITGVAGFVGGHAARAFVGAFGADARIAGIGREARPPDLPEEIAYHRLDLADSAAVTACLAELRPTDVLHLAAAASVQQSLSAPAAAWKANVSTLIDFAEILIAEAPGANVLFASSGEVYGRAFLSGRPMREGDETLPMGTYPRTKLAGEQVLADLLPKGGIRTVILRPFNHIGAGQDERFVVASFAAQIARIEAGLAPPVVEVGDLSAKRDFLDARDVARAYAALIASAESLPPISCFNISSGRPRTVESILDALRGLARSPFEVRQNPDRMRPSEIATACGDAGALSAAVGWSPRFSWDDTLATVMADARERARAPSPGA